MSFGDIRQRTVLEVQSIGADTVSILAQATRELQAEFREAVREFDAGDSTATQLIASLGKLASGLTTVANLANHEAAELARLEAATLKAAEAADRAADIRTRAADRAADAEVKGAQRAAAASASFVDKANADLQKKDAVEAKLDAESRKRMDQKAAKDKATLDAIGAAADKAAKAAQKAADDMAAADARKSAANDRAMGDLEGYAALQRKLGDMERLSAQESRDAIASTTAARRHGTEAIADHIVKTRQEIAAIDAEKASWVQTTAATREQIQALKDMGIIQGHVTTAQVRLGDQGQKSGQAAARGFLELSRAVEDFAVAGPLGALNNIPGIFQNIGQYAGLSAGAVAGLTAGVSLFATASYVAYRNWDHIVDAFAGNAMAKPIDDTKELTARLKELSEIRVKTSIDYAEIDVAQGKLDRLKADEGAYNRLKSGKTEEQEKRSKVVGEAITEGGGAENISRAVEETLPIQYSAETLQLQSDLARNQGYIDDPNTTIYQKQAASEAVNFAKKQIRNNMAQERQNHAIRARGIVGRAGEGSKDDLATLSSLFQGNEGAFTDRGVDPLRFGAGLENATGANLFAPERAKIAEKRKQDEEAAQKRLAKAELDAKVANEKAQDEEDAAFARADDKTIEGAELARKTAKEIRRNRARAAAGEARSMTREEKAEAADFGKLRGVGSGEADRVRQQNLGRIFQQETGANDQTSIAAGKGMDASMSKGLSMQQAFLMEIRKLNGIIARQNAELDAASEAFGQAAGAIGQISAKQSMSGRFNARGGMQVRSFFPFGGG